jgi:hypothetical protein
VAWVEQATVAARKPGDIVVPGNILVMDNLGSHRERRGSCRHLFRRRRPVLPAALERDRSILNRICGPIAL